MDAIRFHDVFTARGYRLGALEPYREMAANAAFDLSDVGYTNIRFEPGDGTRYDITLVHRDSDGHIVIALPEFRTSYYLPSLGGLTPDYVTEKWGLRGGSAAVFALLMQCISEARTEVGV
jgi:hypothetical protein